ncbi:MAG: L-tyrosine/L-tryptophan isonitrile synthase family protein [Pleurocapsa sp. MO_192.B19]|nr:L-tyrosine/L-tryptophan isonitrile synthase family protein [Pleurocapsa sp. MO_192.B19]
MANYYGSEDLTMRLATIESQNDDFVVSQFLEIFRDLQVTCQDDSFETQGKALLTEQLRYFIEDSKPLKMILPGFPCKSPNTESKVFSSLPDRGEEIALRTLDNFCEQVRKFYPPGCQLTIFSDGTIFSDIIGVPEEAQQSYNIALQGLIEPRHLFWESLDSFFSLENGYDALREEFMSNYFLQDQDEDRLNRLFPNDDETCQTYLGLKRFLFNDNPWTDSDSPTTTKSRLKRSGQYAKTMIRRNKAFTRLIQEKFPHHIRFSIHSYNNSGPKFSIHLLPDDCRCVTPWHNVVVKNKGDREILMKKEEAQKLPSTAIVKRNGQPWYMVESRGDVWAQCELEIVKPPRTGIRISYKGKNNDEKSPCSLLCTATLRSLCMDYGFVVLRGFHIGSKQELLEFSSEFGNPVVWNFGAVHTIRPQKPANGFIASREAVPLHWDLSMPPSYLEQSGRYEDFTPQFFTLYCHKAPANGEGQTTLVDGRKVLENAGYRKVETWKKVTINYYTQFTYFGGKQYSYPLLGKHPITGEDIFRYQEGWNSKLQTVKLSSTSLPPQDFQELIGELQASVYDDSCFISHDWYQGDLLIVENHYMLHGRTSVSELTDERELWRVQHVPILAIEM